MKPILVSYGANGNADRPGTKCYCHVADKYNALAAINNWKGIIWRASFFSIQDCNKCVFGCSHDSPYNLKYFQQSKYKSFRNVLTNFPTLVIRCRFSVPSRE